MNLKTKLAASLLMVGSVSMAQATTYTVSAVFNEPMKMSGGTVGDTIFDGTFDWDGMAVSNASGMMNSSMASMNQDISLGGSTGTTVWSQTGSTVTVSVFKNLNDTNVFWGGGYATGDFRRYGGLDTAGNWDGNTPNANAYMTFSFDTTTMSGILADMVYGDCTANGLMMGETCMTGHSAGGTMMATPLSLSIAASPVPVPAAAWLFGGALMSLFGANRRKKVLPA